MPAARRRSTAFAFLLAGVCVAVTPAASLAQQPAGELFFLNSTSDRAAVGHIDRDGRFHQTYVSGYWAGFTPSSASAEVINTANGFLIYDPVTQAARVVRVTHGGGVSMGTAYGFSYWNIILGRSTFLFFYSTIGMAYVGYVDTLGQVVGTDYWPWGFGVWTHIVATDNNLVFYNASSGIIAVGHMSVDAKWGGQTDAFHMIQGCTSVTTTGQYVLCYNRQTGLLQTMYITENGYALPKDVADVGVDYTHVVPHGQDVVLYSSERGATRIGHLDDGGLWVSTDQSNVVMDVPLSSVPAGTVTSTGDALLFYNSTWGVATVGKVSREGKLTLTDRIQLEKGWTDIVATAR